MSVLREFPNTPGASNSNLALIGIEHSPDDGRIRYRIGKQHLLRGNTAFSELWTFKDETHIAGDDIPIYSDHESLRVYGTAHDDKSNFYDFKMIVEKKENGLIFAQIQVKRDGERIDSIEGFIYARDKHGERAPLVGLSNSQTNPVIIQTRDKEIKLDLGRVDYLVVDCGTVAKQDPLIYRSQHEGNTLCFYLSSENSMADRDFGNLPIATIKRSKLATKFEPSLVQSQLANKMTHGYVAPKHTGLGFGRA